MTEKDLQRVVLGLFREAGWRVCHFSDSRRQVRPGVFVGDVNARGFPDVVAVRGSRVVFVELKSDSGRLSDDQRGWLDDVSAAGCEAFVWRPSHLKSGAVHRVMVSVCSGEFFGSWV
jgi:hypothetical protein